jgi:hypothetical protein
MKQLPKELAWHAAVAVASAHLVLSAYAFARPFLQISEYLAGTGLKPYQYRWLMAVLSRPLVAIFRHFHLDTMLAGKTPPFNSSVSLAFITIHVLCAIWLVREVRGWLTEATGDERVGFWAAPVVLLTLPSTLYAYPQYNWFFPYDLPALTLNFVLLRAAAHERWHGFYPLFALATLNRETTFLVTAAWAIANLGRRQEIWIWMHGAAQVALWGAVKYALYTRFASNPAEGDYEVVMNNLSLNMNYLLQPIWWPQILSSNAFLWIPCIALWRSHRDHHLRAMIALYPLWVVAMICVGHIVEIRIFSEFTPVFFTATALLVYNAFATTPGDRSTIE